jgi:hypothetical protein
MTAAKSTSIQECSRIHAIVLLQDLMKRDVCRHAVEMLLVYVGSKKKQLS